MTNFSKIVVVLTTTNQIMMIKMTPDDIDFQRIALRRLKEEYMNKIKEIDKQLSIIDSFELENDLCREVCPKITN
jgi:hypothetical protein